MPSSSLTSLYFESVRGSHSPLLWIGCSIAVHVGLVILPLGGLLPNRQNIAFKEGNAGVEVELVVNGEMPLAAAVETNFPTAAEPIPESQPPLIAPAEPEEVPESVSKPKPPATRKSSIAATSPSSTPHENVSSQASRAGSAAPQPAAVVYAPQPPYPAGAHESGVEGIVRLRLRVVGDGCPAAVEVARSSGRFDLDNSALSTVKRQWIIRAARTSNGSTVESTKFVTVRFQLNS